jgi:hypothetical protein
MASGLNCKPVVIIELRSTLLRYTLNDNCIYDQIGDMISSKGGVVSAEELAPYLDVPPYSEDTKASYDCTYIFGMVYVLFSPCYL